jgi:acyl dehydratase
MTLWWEDFEVGAALDIGKHTFGAEEIVAFGRQFDPQPYHVDPAAAKSSPFGGLIASGWHVCAAGMRMLTEQILGRAQTLGSPGIEKVRWLKPVRAGDTLAYRVIVAESRPSASKPGLGLVKHRWEARNQDGELALTLEGWILVRRRKS